VPSSSNIFAPLLPNLISRLVVIQGGNMPLTKTYVRNGNRTIIASITSGFSNNTEIVRESTTTSLARSTTTLATHGMPGKLVSVDTADPGLLIKRK